MENSGPHPSGPGQPGPSRHPAKPRESGHFSGTTRKKLSARLHPFARSPAPGRGTPETLTGVSAQTPFAGANGVLLGSSAESGRERPDSPC